MMRITARLCTTANLTGASGAAQVPSNGVVVSPDDNAIADLPLGGATGHSLAGPTANVDRCGAPVVVVWANRTISGGNQTGGAADSFVPSSSYD